MLSYPSELGNTLPVSRPQPYTLRPLTTGELLDRTFQLYRARFRLFIGIAAFVPAVSVIFAIVNQLLVRHQAGAAVHPASRAHYSVAVYGFAVWIISFVLYGVAQAAAVSAIANVYLGRDTSVSGAYRHAKKHWMRYVGVALAQLWSAGWLSFVLFAGMFGALIAMRRAGNSASVAVPIVTGLLGLLLLGSMGYAVWAYIRVSLAMPAAVVEDLKVRASLKRSKALLRDRKFRIFLLLLLLLALYIVIGAIQGPLAMLMMRSHASTAVWLTGITLLVQFVTTTLITPVGAIAFCLFYIDERVRREGFDIEWMMTGNAGAGESVAAAPAVAAPDLA